MDEADSEETAGTTRTQPNQDATQVNQWDALLDPPGKPEDGLPREVMEGHSEKVDASRVGHTSSGVAEETQPEPEPFTGIDSEDGNVTGKRRHDGRKNEQGPSAAGTDEPPTKTTHVRRSPFRPRPKLPIHTMTEINKPMSVGTLDVRRLSSRRTQCQLYRPVSDADLDILAVQETKVEGRRRGNRGHGNTSASRSRSRSRSQTVKRATWADTIKGSGGTTSTGKKNTVAKKARGEAQSEHVNDPRIQSLEAENLQLRRELAELKEALNSIREQFSHRDEDKFKALSPLAGKPKRKAPYPGTVSETDGEDEMAEPSEDTAATATPPAKTKTRGKLASIEKTLGCMMEMLSGMETRLTQLERPKVQAKSRLTATTILTQADPNPDGKAKGLLDHLQ
ncbi:hypothetical protein HPB50_004751 [Hyalomma asiaticum]|uniref:Uncharacterized protein n=1 Tax=Hyalomma asiaticum TaxID=266040 RepID=A0ACB7TEJ0_HYAAI|nr:hypothetical protein HPB50_004751 [Hyalomma asiaticum]